MYSDWSSGVASTVSYFLFGLREHCFESKKLKGMWLRNGHLKLGPYNILMFYDYSYLRWLTLRNCDIINISGFKSLHFEEICCTIIDNKYSIDAIGLYFWSTGIDF